LESANGRYQIVSKVWETVQVSRATTGVYGGVAAEQRRERRRAQLIEAALDLLGTEGWQACTVRAICGRARLTPRYFYESFPDRDVILLAVFDEISQEGAAVALRALGDAGTGARSHARAAIGAFIEFVTDDPRRARVLFVEAMGSEVLAKRRFETLRLFAGLVAEQARIFYRMPDASDPLVETTALMVVGGLAETLLAWLDGTLAISRHQLIEDCTDLFVATGEASVRLVRARSDNR
jgi:AcrR family transcriptional regulator